jgi:hypothetical protein
MTITQVVFFYARLGIFDNNQTIICLKDALDGRIEEAHFLQAVKAFAATDPGLPPGPLVFDAGPPDPEFPAGRLQDQARSRFRQSDIA